MARKADRVRHKNKAERARRRRKEKRRQKENREKHGFFKGGGNMSNIELPESVKERENAKVMKFLSDLVVSQKYPETINMVIAGKVSIKGVDVTNGKSNLYLLQVKNGEEEKRYIFIVTEEPKEGENPCQNLTKKTVESLKTSI